MSAPERFRDLLAQCPLIAIIRGVDPQAAAEVGEALYEGGIRIIEVPLNSPEPLDSIARLRRRLGDRAMVGAGTVLRVEEVSAVAAAGGELIVSPVTTREVIAASAAGGLVSCPGFFTPTEAFAAIDAGAHALKLFPAEAASPAVLAALRAVLPREVPVIVVGGVTPQSMVAWKDASATGFGLGSGLYRLGQSPSETLNKARAFVAALRGL
ncbi:MAG TPA: 2-dehydro-3-deoxy-6-phosphogalactonate aldolase [Sphingomicrobium sp.]|nr:2-dehydro-3-deoxy-6-phosphogalactonate aldolase [Sphingomicrobium sp.]